MPGALRQLALLTLGIALLHPAAAEPLPVEAFASLPDVSQVQLSPDGRHLVSLVRLDTEERKGTVVTVLNLAENTTTAPTYARNEVFVINWVRWLNNRDLLISARFPEVRFGVPTTETRLLAVDIETGETRPAIPQRFMRRHDHIPQFQDGVIDFLPDEESAFLIELSLESPESSSVIKVDIAKNKARTVERSRRDVTDWITDQQSRVRIAIRRDETRFDILHRAPEDDKWNVLWEFDAFSVDQVWPMGFDLDPSELYVRAYHDGREAIFKVDLNDPALARELVLADPVYDVTGGLIYSQATRAVVGITFSRGGGWTYWDENFARLQRGIDSAMPDTANVLYDFSADERRYVLLATGDTEPGRYFVGNRDRGSLDLVANRYGALPAERLVGKRRIEYAARDGLAIESYLTVPGNGENGPLPTVVFPHGGPISFDHGGFDYWTQYFANRGYAVLQMNFRGSAGYGHAFMASGLQNWGLEMQNDVEDGTRWLIEQGIADPERICVVGASYGGYAALMEAARNPDLYRCAISFAGVTDVAALVKSHRRYTNYEVVKEQVGSDLRDLKRRSPIEHADQIRIPVLLAHGTEDRSVGFRHSKRMHRALEKQGASVTFLELDGGDHYLSNETHRVDFFRAMDAFLTTYLAASPAVVSADNRSDPED